MKKISFLKVAKSTVSILGIFLIILSMIKNNLQLTRISLILFGLLFFMDSFDDLNEKNKIYKYIIRGVGILLIMVVLYTFISWRNKKLQSDWNEFGEENFIFEIAEVLEKKVEENSMGRKDRLKELETKWIKKLESFDEKGYNESCR